MWKNYLKIAWRNIIRHKGYTFLNVAGLAIGIAACLVISFFIRNELGYDNYHQDADRVYRVAVDIQTSESNRVFAATCGPLAPALERDFPQVEASARLWQWHNLLVKYGEENIFYEDNYFLADPGIFDVLTVPLVKGDPKTALSRPSTLVIAEETARKYFGEEDPLGKVLEINGSEFEITGVMKNLPYNSHLDINFITSFATIENEDWFAGTLENWHSTMFYTYIKLHEHVDVPAFEEQVKTAADAYVGDIIKEWGIGYHYFLQPIKSIHLHSDLTGEAEVPGSAVNVYIFTVIAVLILLIASLNYINLTTAQSSNRAKEVGVRKVVGAAKAKIFNQFVSESLLLTAMALIFALLLVFITHPLFESLSGQTYNLSEVFTLQFIGMLIGLTFLVGMAAATYPALFLSSFRPVAVLKGGLNTVSKGASLRKVLVVGQFTISLMLIVGTIMVYRQLDFMKDQKLGFDREQMLVLPVRGGISIADRYEQVKEEFLNHSSIISLTASSDVPGKKVYNFAASLSGEEDDKGQSMYFMFVDADFLKTYGIEMLAGRPFNKELQTDAESAFLINEKAVKAFGWGTPEEAIGKKMNAGFGREGGEIIGVYKDFHYRSLQAPVEPLVLAIVPWRFNYISLKLNTMELPSTMAFVEKKWQELFPGSPYEYAFLDQEFDKQYAADEKTGRTFLVFTSIAIFIACLGLFGLATYIARQRTKEIGIRKVLGASVAGVVGMLSMDFVKLVMVAVLISTPLSYLLVSRWLENFAFRMEIGWVTFVAAGLTILVIALLTVSFQSVKAALANPVDSLRSE
ncbi:ABC transporter permease [Negadavirga shengliensis]|uniref:ABC transporter permease n=1 Tax=Negadavirga shengliensis TaxID=1389218 RepID=A0ABV9T7Z6_9BACT